METENSLVLREAAKDAKMAYFNHLAGGGKRDPDRERWIEALTDGADAITRTSVLASRLAQVERERDAAVKDCAMFPCRTCSDMENGDLCYTCHLLQDTTRSNYEWRGVCMENTKENETLQEEEPR